MYACLHSPSQANGAALRELAASFSPSMEVTASDTVIFSIDGLGRLIGSPHQIAAEIARQGAERGVTASLAIAANPDTALLAARSFPGVHIIRPGEEGARLEAIPLEQVPMADGVLETLDRWGVRTLGDLAELPPLGVQERLGEEGLRLYNLALGRLRRPLKLAATPETYTERLEIEEPLRELEPLLFLIARLLNELCRRLEMHAMATNRIRLTLELEAADPHVRTLELPIPQTRSQPLLKLLQLDLEAHPPGAPVTALGLTIEPVEPRRTQDGLFLPQAPEPEKLQITLARIAGLVGENNVGSPELLDTHRPDAFRMRQFRPRDTEPVPERPLKFRLVLRLYRPSLAATVRLASGAPQWVRANGVRGEVKEATGPWRGSGDWWSSSAWSRDEWDVVLTDGGLYRIFQNTAQREWFVDGVYD